MNREKIEFRRKLLHALHQKASLIFHETHKVCGIYAIFNKVNGKIYIGQTSQKIYAYLRSERESKLRLGEMHNCKLQNEFKEYGADQFDFYIIEKFLISTENMERLQKTLNYLEVFYIDQFGTTNSNYGYNIQKGWDDEHTLEDIMREVNVASSKIDSFAYGEFSDKRKLPFPIPASYINEEISFPNEHPGLASCIDQFIKKDHKVDNFNDYVKLFLDIYTNRPNREYIRQYEDVVPFLLARQVLRKFPNTRIQ
ncbi:GIY-YIG nuclease family protein [Bacillus sp. Marseille-P3661]|uniref:GIY-YIG nuclease family protein n=1 Tax=Bacillus sp. Marseille-P3661 TaxID=1936234 RepID=UPI0015E15EFE|nr:GIY-YIG nuclease family protein [Bacillus sp. Marseille-P3661]